MGQLRAELDFTSVDAVIRGGLHEYLDRLQLKMNAIDSSLRDDFAVPRRAVHARARSSTQGQSQTTRAPDGHSRRAAPQDVYQYDRPGDTVAAGGPAAAGAAQPHAGQQLLAAHRAGEPLHQLAAGSAGQLPRPAGVSRTDDHGLLARGGSRRRDDGHQPVRFFPRAERRARSRSPTTSCSVRSWRRSSTSPRRAAPAGVPRFRSPTIASTRSTSWSI